MDAGARRGFREELHHVRHGSELIHIRSGERRWCHRRRKWDWPRYRSPARIGGAEVILLDLNATSAQ
ncbi:MAG: hypothetical protein DMG97_12185 [Acidobacteria bacterium]|nr:MAG: hypothetical protein DMG98_14210 [Acidobacteriota bacterium]PYV72461.1 MAG: hypothetical protein DMG96_26055 [Acidobacteriota bacterium]PYV73020.1 MAG: hypothetical protein DMG97_12185 [Acidobacteriota bacterium]